MNNTTNTWQAAAAFFEQNYELETHQLKKNSAFQSLDAGIQQTVIQLFNNKNLNHSLLDQPVAVLYDTLSSHDLSGQMVDSYELIELIAHGGMSSVYRARKPDTLNQKDVAIKLIPTNLQTANTSALFKRELETLSNLHHPNIISMHHGDVTPSGTPYLVMELVENALQIDKYFKRQKTTQAAIVNHFITLCQVIDYAHQNEVIHQDIKPSNVLMDEHGHLLVLDFGVSALTDTIPDHHAYTLSYATPEQTIKDQLPKPFFDTFAITSLLIKCLSHCPDHQPGWQNKAISQLKIDKDLKSILLKGIAVNPSQRYQHADQLALDLKLWQKKLPISELKNNPIYRFKKAISRYPGTAALSTVTVVSMLIGLIFYQQQFQIASAESAKAQQIKNILIDAIDQSDPDISKGDDLTVRDMLKQVELSHFENPTSDISTAKELYLTLAQAFYKLGDYESTEKNILKILEIEPLHTDALLVLAELKVQLKQIVQANQLLNQLSINNAELSAGQIIRLHLLKANSAIINNEYDVAEEQFLTAEQLAEGTSQNSIKLKVMAAHANGLLEQDRMELAVEKINDAVTLSELTLGEQHSTTLELKSKLAETFMSFSGEKVEKANRIFEQIIPQQKQLLGDDHPAVAKSLFLNATGLRSLNKLAAARNNAEEALSIVQQQLGSNHILTGKILMSLAAINLAEKNFNKATEYARMAVDNHQVILGEEHPETLQYKTSYVAILVEDHQYEEALKLLLQIHPIQTEKLGADHRGTLFVDIVLSKTYTALNRFEEGVLAGERCHKNAQKSETNSIMEVYCAITLEKAYFSNQQYPEATSLIEQYQQDPLVTNRPSATKQFTDHLDFIRQLKKTDT